MTDRDSARPRDGFVIRHAHLALLLAAALPHACSKSNSEGAPTQAGTSTNMTSTGSGGSRPDAGAGATSGAGGGGATSSGGIGGAITGAVGGSAGAATGGGMNTGGARSDGGVSQDGSAGKAGTAGSGQAGGGQAGVGGQAGTGGGPSVDGAMPMPLRMHWIDVEGGAATLIATPSGETILVDAGWAGARDPDRIVAVLKNELQAKQLDYLITTHYHSDHVGGVPTLAGLVPIAHFIDHGDTVEPSAAFNSYLTIASAARIVVKPGDKLTLGNVELTFVTAAGQVVDPPLPESVPNTTCAGATMKSDVAGAENPMSVGFVLRFGKFDFVDLGDLTWNVEQKLMCPTNRIGLADLYQVSHHGLDLSSSPQLVQGLAPTVAVMNNGETKGGAPAAFDVLRASPGLQDLWSLHRVTANDAQHNADDALTANTAATDAGYGIKAVVLADGSYTLTNGRNATTRSYMSR